MNFEELNLAINRLSGLIPKPDHRWLLQDMYLSAEEKKFMGTDIWIVSPDLRNITEKSAIYEGIVKNAQRGIKYTYIAPYMPEIEARLPYLRHIFKGNQNNLSIYQLPPDTFNLLATAHIAIYNPKREPIDVPSKVYLELPISHILNSQNNTSKYWLEVSEDCKWPDRPVYKNRRKQTNKYCSYEITVIVIIPGCDTIS